MTILRCTRLPLVAAILACAPLAAAQGGRGDYERAAKFLPDQIRSLAYDGQVDPQWIGKTARFWYRKDGPFGKQFVVVDAAALTTGPAFDHERLAKSLSTAAKQSVTSRALPFDVIRFTDEGGGVQFEWERATWTCRLDSYECARSSDRLTADEGVTGRGQPPADRLPRTEVPSPDGKLLAFVRDHNLWVRVRSTGEQIQLSRDGERYYDYAMPLPSPTLMVAQGTEDVVQAPSIFWSPDSTRIATYLMDQRNFPRLTITQSAPSDQFRPKYYSYAYPLPVDFDLPTAKLVSFDVQRRKQITVWAKPLNQLYYGGPSLEWTADSGSVHLSRDRARLQARAIDVDRRQHGGGAHDSRREGRSARRHVDSAHALVQRRTRGRVVGGARRLEPLLPLRRPARRPQESDHQGRLGGPRHRLHRRAGARALLQRRRPRGRDAIRISVTSTASASMAAA